MAGFDKYLIDSRETIRNAFKKQDLNKKKFILVTDEDRKIVGIVTDGDFRRAIWDAVFLKDPIATIMNRNFKSLSGGYRFDDIRDIFLKTNIVQIPVLDDGGRLADIVFRDDFKASELTLPSRKMDLPVVIMAGGEGARLDPFTRILPKPLIPVGEKSVIEIIMERFSESGMNHFYISLYHRAKMIKAYFEDFGKPYRISYIEEESPLGTAGALKFLEGKIGPHFFVTNCDIIIDENYAEVYEFHKQGNYALTLMGSMQHMVVPYGVLKMRNGGDLDEISEKPEYDFLVNTGMYLFNADILRYIPANKRYDITDLIDALRAKNERIGIYPVSEKSWIDIGQWEAYRTSIKRLAEEDV